jgi:hypothetical protein
LIPLETNEPHEIGSVLRKLAEEGTITHLMPNVVHDVQLLAAAPQLMCAHKEIHKESVHLVVVGMLGVDGAAVDAVHDVIDRQESLGAATQHPPSNVEVGHLLLGHGLGLEMNAEEVGVVVVELITKASSKVLP